MKLDLERPDGANLAHTLAVHSSLEGSSETRGADPENWTWHSPREKLGRQHSGLAREISS